MAMASSEPSELLLDGVNCQKIKMADIQSSSNTPLGFGGYSDVIKGTFKELDVAVKIIDRYRFTNDQEKRILACKEARAMCAINHHSIVELYGIVMDQPTQTYGIVIEFMKHGSLRELNLKLDDSLPLSLKVGMMTSIAEALRYLHLETSNKPRLIHSDVKMDNILVNHKLQAKLGDFGISKLQGFTSRITGSRRPHGTITHMAPELFSPELAGLHLPKPSCESDVWSFGITLYEVLKGDTPFEGLADAIVVNQIQKGIQSACSQQLEDSSPNFLKALILECLELMPANRPDFERIATTLQAGFEEHYKNTWDEDVRTVRQSLEETDEDINLQIYPDEHMQTENGSSATQQCADSTDHANGAVATPEAPSKEPIERLADDIGHRLSKEIQRFSRRINLKF